MIPDRIDPEVQAEAAKALHVPETPAYVYSEPLLRRAVSDALTVANSAGCKLLYTLKPCGLAAVVEIISDYVDGFAASSPFEARLARDIAMGPKSIHCYSPALGASDMAEVASIAHYLSLNSVRQFQMAAEIDSRHASLGLRVNPQTSFVSDSRYDPCRRHSKLGIPRSEFNSLITSSGIGHQVDGIHIHANCESDDLNELAQCVEALEEVVRDLPSIAWVNLGGGYYFHEESDSGSLEQAVSELTSDISFEVFIEPGTSMVQESGMLVSEVLDVFINDGTHVAVLDVSTSHMPEVFEYGLVPRIHGPHHPGDRRTVLAGRSCLAGDVFGEYLLEEALLPGDRVAILDAGAYSHARSAPFNGIPIPSSFLLRSDGSLDWISSYSYVDFANRNAAPLAVTS